VERQTVRFLLVYIAEAHAKDEWPIGDQISFEQHKTIEARVTAARLFASEMKKKYGFNLPLVADPVDNSFDKAYSAWPVRFYVIQDSKISYIAVAKNLGDKCAEKDVKSDSEPSHSNEIKQKVAASTSDTSTETLEAILKANSAISAPGCEGACVGEYSYDFRDLGAWLEQYSAKAGRTTSN
jgi:hypothetical protein